MQYNSLRRSLSRRFRAHSRARAYFLHGRFQVCLNLQTAVLGQHPSMNLFKATSSSGMYCPICLSICLSTYLPIYLPTYLFNITIYLSVYLYLSIDLSIYPSIQPASQSAINQTSNHLSICLSIHTHTPICISLYRQTTSPCYL